MSAYNEGGHMDSAPEYSYGYGPGGPSHGHDHGHRHGSPSNKHGPSQGHSKRERSEKAQHLHGESANYDNLPGPAPSEGQTVYDHRNDRQYSGDTKDRSFTDYFYKKPDSSYSGMYGTDYHPEISTKVFTATAAVVALFYGVSKYRARQKEKEKRKRHGKHAHHRGQDDYVTNGSEYHYNDSHSRY
ncbi:hypothetical protein GGI20_000421 [Coemansia sp. BCRC 34301]|nr:hypothetical protein GGI20_000421 [Coemansia sp. BCRC 34301]